MAVAEQTPYIEYTANGATTSFALGFACESKDHLIVLIDDIEPPIATWSLTGGNVVFTTAPAAGKKITLQRNTPFSRTTDYQSYNNSFRPPAVNKDFDWIWWKLQELGVADWILSNRIDALKNYVDDRDDELRAYLLEEIRKQGVALDQLEDYYNYLMQRLAEIAVNQGWDASFVVDGNETQKVINDKSVRVFESIADLLTYTPRGDGQVVKVKSYYAPNYALLNPYIGGSDRVYNSSLSSVNNGGTIINGWVLINPKWTFEEWGAKGNDPSFDDSIPMQKAIDFVASTKPIGGVGQYTGAKLSCEVVNQKYYIQNPLRIEKNTIDDAKVASQFPLNIDFTGSTIIPNADNLTCIVLNRWFVNLKQPRILNELNKANVTGVLFGPTDIATRQVMGFIFCKVYDLHTNGISVGVMSRPGASSGGSTTNSYYNELYSPVFVLTETAIWMAGNPNALDNQNTRFTVFNPRHLYGKCSFKLECCDTFNVWGGSSEIISDVGNPNSAVIYLPQKWTNGVVTHTIDNSANFHGFVAESCDRAYYNGSFNLGLNDCNFIGMTNNPITVGFGREISQVEGNFEVIEKVNSKLARIAAKSLHHNVQFYMGVRGDGDPEIYADRPIKMAQSLANLTVNDVVRCSGLSKASGELVFNTSASAHALLLNTNTANTVTFYNTGGGITRFGGSTAITPFGDNNTSCGNASNRWTQVYAANGTIQTSDERLKQDFRSLNDAEKSAAIEIKNNIGLFRFIDAVKEKGDSARKHVGVLAQQVISILEKHGLDWHEYGFICYDEWDATEDVEIDGKLIKGVEAGNRYSIRYDELTMFILAAI